MKIRDIHTIEQEIHHEGGRRLDSPVTRVAACATLQNPLAGLDGVEDLSEVVDLSVKVGEILTARALDRLDPAKLRGYGKAVVVGTGGDLEHGAAMIHVRIGLSMRSGIKRGRALIPGNGKVGPAGTQVDLIFGGIDDGWDYDAMDTMPIVIPGAPRPDEVLLIVGFSGTRPNARISGASEDQVAELVKSLS